MRYFWGIFLVSILFLAGFSGNQKEYLMFNINHLGKEGLDQLKSHKSTQWWVEADDKLLVLAEKNSKGLQRLAPFSVLKVKPQPENLFLFFGHKSNLKKLSMVELVSAGRMSVGQLTGSDMMTALSVHDRSHDEPHGSHFKLLPFEKNIVLARQSANQRARELPSQKNSSIVSILSKLNADRWFQSLESLAEFNSYSLVDGVDAARDWLVEEFSKLSNIRVSTQEFSFRGYQAFNVIAEIPGSDQKNRDQLIIGAHYDSISRSPRTSAPGAEDNASGTAALLEIARVLNDVPLKKSVKLIAFSGEEQGLFGSKHYVRELIEQNLEHTVKKVLIMDMIGYSKDNDLDCLLETGSAHEDLVEELTIIANSYTNLRIAHTYNYWGSDHAPFIDRGLPAVLTIENDYSEYPSYHRTSDTSDKISKAMGLEIIKMNTAALLSWAM